MFQGMGEETEELNEYFGFKPNRVNHMILSHAHIDHCGLIPRLVAEGFEGTIFCTSATMDLARILMTGFGKNTRTRYRVQQQAQAKEQPKRTTGFVHRRKRYRSFAFV